jgi:hypothetical protein
MEGCAIDVDRDTCRVVEQKREERRCEGQRLIGAGRELEMGQVSGMTLSAALCGVVGNSRQEFVWSGRRSTWAILCGLPIGEGSKRRECNLFIQGPPTAHPGPVALALWQVVSGLALLPPTNRKRRGVIGPGVFDQRLTHFGQGHLSGIWRRIVGLIVSYAAPPP